METNGQSLRKNKIYHNELKKKGNSKLTYKYSYPKWVDKLQDSKPIRSRWVLGGFDQRNNKGINSLFQIIKKESQFLPMKSRN